MPRRIRQGTTCYAAWDIPRVPDVKRLLGQEGTYARTRADAPTGPIDGHKEAHSEERQLKARRALSVNQAGFGASRGGRGRAEAEGEMRQVSTQVSPMSTRVSSSSGWTPSTSRSAPPVIASGARRTVEAKRVLGFLVVGQLG